MRRWIAAAAALVALVASALPGSAGGYRSWSEKLAAGVTHMVIKDPQGPFRIHVVSIRMDKPSTLDVELATGKLPGFETTSRMARRRGAIAAINGDYARPSGRPVMAFAQDGRLLQTPLVWGRNFAVDLAETTTYVGHPTVETWAYESDTAIFHEIDRLNAGRPQFDEMAAFTREGGSDERPPRYACASRLIPDESPRFSPDGLAVEANHYVDHTGCNAIPTYPQGGTVITTPIGGTREAELATLAPGEQVTLGWSFGWNGVFDALGGNPTLVEEGAISVRQQNDPFFLRHPRTGVGSTPDGRVLFVTVDGRQQGYSVGMTPRQFGKLFLSLGADYALNLDGGGSTTMAIYGRVRNRPSDGAERPVSSALLLLPGRDPGEAQPESEPSPAPLPQVGQEEAADTWAEIVEDPASTGGLASMLRVRGLILPPSLERAARIFDRS